MMVSIETPVFKGSWLRQCVDSVLTQDSKHWTFSLLWDGGDDLSRKILEELDALNHPNVKVYFRKNCGIANARRFLTESSAGDYILPLDDDDVLAGNAVDRFLTFAASRPWGGIIRARRQFIDEEGRVVDMEPWFPFETRHYQHGMATDLFNQSQPYLIKRSCYEQTAGWEGFEDFMFAGEDCDIFLKLEEVAPIELLDETLYYYRINPKRASDTLTVDGAHEMWRRLADKTIKRIGLPIKRANDIPPFRYETLSRPRPTAAMIDFVVLLGDGTRDCEQAKRHLQSLARYGITEDAVHFVTLNESSAGSRNRGSKQTTRPVICFLDEDVYIEGSEIFDELLTMMHEHQAEIVGPKILDAQACIYSADPYFNEDRQPVSKGIGERGESKFNYVSDVPWLPAQFLLVRREVMKAVGGFDDGYVSGQMESADFCLKARLRDFKCLYAGTVAVSYKYHGDVEDFSVSLRRFQEKWNNYPHLFR